jgi:hypothetical protein
MLHIEIKGINCLDARKFIYASRLLYQIANAKLHIGLRHETGTSLVAKNGWVQRFGKIDNIDKKWIILAGSMNNENQ